MLGTLEQVPVRVTEGDVGLVIAQVNLATDAMHFLAGQLIEGVEITYPMQSVEQTIGLHIRDIDIGKIIQLVE